MNNFKAWATNTAYILFDDSKNDLRALPKTVRLQLFHFKFCVVNCFYTLHMGVSCVQTFGQDLW